jgi:RNase P subunit RPR2
LSFETESGYVGDGWKPLITKLHADLLAIDPDYTVDQIKEKFGELRYYYTAATTVAKKQSQMRELVDAAERASHSTCEWCGETAKTKLHRGWYRTLCEKCTAELKAKQELQ